MGSLEISPTLREIFAFNLQKILDKRRREGMTQIEIAKRMGIDRTDLSHWRRGVFPRPEQIDRLAVVLGIRAASLFQESQKTTMS